MLEGIIDKSKQPSTDELIEIFQTSSEYWNLVGKAWGRPPDVHYEKGICRSRASVLDGRG